MPANEINKAQKRSTMDDTPQKEPYSTPPNPIQKQPNRGVDNSS